MRALSTFRRTIAGAAILKDWLGEGASPVPQELSNHRASICVECPENRSPDWWEQHTNAIASWIRRCLLFKNELGYSVAREDEIHMCRACGCCLKLKVHVPIAHIKAHAVGLSDYPEHCWQRKESAA